MKIKKTFKSDGETQEIGLLEASEQLYFSGAWDMTVDEITNTLKSGGKLWTDFAIYERSDKAE
jgi:hypothetical protein